MKIDRINITVKDLCNGYEEKGGNNGIEGIIAYNGMLDVRPAYQREFIYDSKKRDEVIRTVLKGFPLNTMYWYKVSDNHYELMDGQQRTISICKYVAEKYQSYSVDEKYYFNQPEDIKKRINDYNLDIFICSGTQSEALDWFKVINIAGIPLNSQEMRNAVYTGSWLSNAKFHFSKPNCAAYNLAKDYIKGNPIRQEILETAIKWIADRDNIKSVEEYMAVHQNDSNANILWAYFKQVIDWVNTIFPVKRKEMRGVEWGLLYNELKNTDFDSSFLEEQVKRLMIDDDVTNKKGIYLYVLKGDEKFLNIRQFSENEKREAYERQNGICKKCNKAFKYEEMQGDHITPWSKGGKTKAENCQMLCEECNRKKSNV